ncbi:MAG: putative metal-binding motif-containing protein [Planctomycetota bacterium]|nr:putative metal-binding motif-containing protein [Planctomycetota bacterium]
MRKTSPFQRTARRLALPARIHSVLSMLSLVAVIFLASTEVSAQSPTINVFQCNNQAGADMMQVVWDVADTCGPFESFSNIEVRVDGIFMGSSGAPSGAMFVGPLAPGAHAFELTARCTGGGSDIALCNGSINCNPAGLITTLNCNVGPSGLVDMTWALPSSLPTYYDGMFVTVDGVTHSNTTPGSPVHQISGLDPGVHNICLETPVQGPWSCGLMVCCTVTIPPAGPCGGAPAGLPCDDGDPCTINDVCDGMGGCNGTFLDTDSDGVCDAFDICPGGDDSLDSDMDGVPDFCDCDPLDGTVFPGATEICGNGIDDDCDTLADCGDPDCATDPACSTSSCGGAPAGSPCDDGDPCTINDICDGMGGCAGELIDADADGYSPACGDCDDGDPAIHPGAPEICNDLVDNDCDGPIDCSDPDCAMDLACSTGPCSGAPAGSPCDDGDPCTINDVCDGMGGCTGEFIDVDGDGVSPACGDCNDNNGAMYPGAVEICNDNKDNDCDGGIDCSDPDCAMDLACTGGGPCTSHIDCDDGDPCTADECIGGTCVYTPIAGCGSSELCNNGIDDDGDMLVDCDDPDCFNDPLCQQGTCSVLNIAAGCDATGGPDSYTISFDVINDTPFDVTHIFVPGVIPGTTTTILSPTVTSFIPPLPPLGSGTVVLSLAGGVPFQNLCFPAGLMAIDGETGELFECCSVDVCVELPPCESCLQITNEGGTWGAATFNYAFTVTNLAGTPPVVAEYAYLVPITPGITLDNDWFPLGGLADGLSAGLSTNISGGSQNQEVCFLVTIHDATLGECCGFVHCFTLPPFLLPPAVPFLRGDANADGSFNIADVITSLDFLFHSLNVSCVQALDSNDDESVDIADAVFSLAALFAGGPEPSPPGATCGVDVTTGPLSCQSFSACNSDGSNP